MRKQLPLFNSSIFWIFLALVGFACLPSNALYYGLFDSTSDEILEAMGWIKPNLSWLWFSTLFFVPFISSLLKAKGEYWQGLFEFIAVLAIFSFVLISAIFAKISLGYSIFVLVVSLIALATNALAKMKVMQSDKFIIASLLSIILLIFSLLCIQPLPFLFRCFMTAQSLYQAKYCALLINPMCYALLVIH